MGMIHAVGPNEALILSGGMSKKKKRIIIGGWAYACSCITDVSYLPLMLMTAFVNCIDVTTVKGVPMTVSGVAQVKIKKELVTIAAEQFGGMKIKDIKKAVTETVEGHLRAILGTLTVEEAYRDRSKFAEMVRDIADPDLGAMGMQIISFTIRDIQDEVGYLTALGRAQIAEVKREATIAEAENNKIAGIREAECERQMMDVVYVTDAKIQNSKRASDMKMSEFSAEVNAAKAQSELAYSLQEAVIHQKIKEENMKVEVIQTMKQIEIEELEIRRREIELNATVKLPAQAESYRLEQIAEGSKSQTEQIAKAEGIKIERIGKAEAETIQRIGTAEAEGKRLRAIAFKKYNMPATASLALDVLPKITASVVSPLAKLDEIVIIGGSDDKTPGDLTRLAGQLPPVLRAVTGESHFYDFIKKAFPTKDSNENKKSHLTPSISTVQP